MTTANKPSGSIAFWGVLRLRFVTVRSIDGADRPLSPIYRNTYISEIFSLQAYGVN